MSNCPEKLDYQAAWRDFCGPDVCGPCLTRLIRILEKRSLYQKIEPKINKQISLNIFKLAHYEKNYGQNKFWPNAECSGYNYFHNGPIRAVQAHFILHQIGFIQIAFETKKQSYSKYPKMSGPQSDSRRPPSEFSAFLFRFLRHAATLVSRPPPCVVIPFSQRLLINMGTTFVELYLA